MSTWTRQQIITSIILFSLLIVKISQSVIVLIYDDLLSPAAHEAAADSLGLWQLLLYGLIYFGSFPVIAWVIRLNQDGLADLHIDRSFVILLILAGSVIIYSLPYNCFAILALLYAVYTLFDGRVKFSVMDHNAVWMILLIIGIFLAATLVMLGLVTPAEIDMVQARSWIRIFLIEIIPISIFEEAVYRGMLYKFLKDLGLSDSLTLFTQAFVFWIDHINSVLHYPVGFWVIIPISGLMLGYLAYRSKSIAISSIAHILYNAFAGFLRLI